MRRHRFILNVKLAAGPLSVSDFEFRNQVKNVLRLDVGEEMVICDGQGHEAVATLQNVGASSVDVTVGTVADNASESFADVVLYCAVLKRENFELVVQKATEAGVRRIVPVISMRTVKTGLRLDRAVKIAKEAAEQSGRGMVPEISEPLTFKAALADADANDVNIIFERDGVALDAAAVGTSTAEHRRKLGAFIGPEGGWETDEVSACHSHGFLVATLGPRTYRAETAAVIASHLLTATGG